MASAQDQIGLILQLRRRGIRDTRVLRAIEFVPRELFVDEAFTEHAYQDIALPIECGQTISQPYVVAYMTEKLALDERHKVLEIGTGSGYQAAVLSHLCRRVYTIERWRELQKAAERRFARLGITNITTIIGGIAPNWGPFGSLGNEARVMIEVVMAIAILLCLGIAIWGAVAVAPMPRAIVRMTRAVTAGERRMVRRA